MRDIGKNIRDLRKRQNMTQDELAARLFVTRQTVSNYENGRTRPDVEQILRLAEIFGTDANAVLLWPAGAGKPGRRGRIPYPDRHRADGDSLGRHGASAPMGFCVYEAERIFSARFLYFLLSGSPLPGV